MDKNLKTIILCGGKGTRMKEETEFKPKPLVKIGHEPILWHIMKIYAHYGFTEFLLALGYKGKLIREYLPKGRTLNDLTPVEEGYTSEHMGQSDAYKVLCVETGLESTTGKRLLHMKSYITEEEFMVTYGDGVADIDINALLNFHRDQGTIGTITGVHPHSKYGLIKIDEDKSLVIDFDQKPLLHDYVSGGFMVFNKKFFDYPREDIEIEDALMDLANEKELSLYKHEGFWKAMDTYREMEEMNELWHNGRPWAIWE